MRETDLTDEKTDRLITGTYYIKTLRHRTFKLNYLNVKRLPSTS